jgi:ATP-dependent Lhr-like helicase
VVSGFFLPAEPAAIADEPDWCDAGVLRRLRMRSLAAIRGSVEPVPPAAFARFLPEWQHVTRPLRGVDGVLAVTDQLAGVPIPASAWESLILPSRVRDYAPGMLDELTAAGEVVWSGQGPLPGRDGWIRLHPAELAAVTATEPEEDPPAESLDARILSVLRVGGGFFAGQLRELADADSEHAVTAALWRLTWSGHVTNDTFAPVRGLLSAGGQAHRVGRRTPRTRTYRGGAGRSAPPPRDAMAAGRWSALGPREPDPAVRATATAGLLLDRYGVVTRGSVQAEQLPGGFAQVYRTLAGFEDAGHCRRGYLIEGLGAAQFAASATVDRLREHAAVADPPPLVAVTLAATDPANPYGAALPWPERSGTGHRPGRKAGALIVLVDGDPALYLERGGRSLLTFTADEVRLVPAIASLVATARTGRLDSVVVEQWDGSPVLGTARARLLRDAGFLETVRGMALRRSVAGTGSGAAAEHDTAHA